MASLVPHLWRCTTADWFCALLSSYLWHPWSWESKRAGMLHTSSYRWICLLGIPRESALSSATQCFVLPNHSMTSCTDLFQMQQGVKEHARSKAGPNVYRAPWTSAFGVAMTLDPYPTTAEGGISMCLQRCADQKAVSQDCLLWTVVALITAFFFYCRLRLILISWGSTSCLDRKVILFFFR